MRRSLSFLVSLIVLSFAPSLALATTVSTIFGPGTPIGQTPTAANGALPAELDAISDFAAANLGGTPQDFDNTANLGAIAFVNSGPFYLPGSGRAFGFAGTGRSDITFTAGAVSAVELLVRGSATGSSGPNSQTIPGSTPFDVSNVSVLIWSELGVQSITQNVLNTGFQTISLDVGALGFLGESITRISLINGTESQSVGANSIAFIGQLTVTTIPEPSLAALLAAAPLLAVLRARRQR